MISAKILAHSINLSSSELITMLWKYPRYLHSEMLTHRVFSRNAASSRAIPFPKMVAMVREEMAIPEFWGAEQKGMQTGDSLKDTALEVVKSMWRVAGLVACTTAEVMHGWGLHKSICNRIIEPWSHITVLVTGTDLGFANFYALRAHKDAEPTLQVLAFRALAAQIRSTPTQLQWGEWHIPHFENTESRDRKLLQIHDGDFSFVKIATARCARLSYLTFDGQHSPEKDLEMHDRLAGPPFHASPFEHCCVACKEDYSRSNFDTGDTRSGWKQYRKFFENENMTNVDLVAIMAGKPAWIQVFTE